MAKPVDVKNAWRFYESLGSPKYVVAPMVNQSELAFRKLCRDYGATLAYSPMVHSEMYVDPKNKKYRQKILLTEEKDRPLIVQFCGHDPATLLAAAQMVEDKCDAVDLNLGCPQKIAARGRYGAYLLDEWKESDVILRIVRTLHDHLNIPVTVKIRLVPGDVEETLIFAKQLQDSGCAILTVHGRTRQEKGPFCRDNNFDMIRRIKEHLDIPVFANGGCGSFEDVQRIIKETGVDGVMVAEALLCHPAIFADQKVDPIRISREYLAYMNEYKVQRYCARPHLFKILFPLLSKFTELRAKLGGAPYDELSSVVDLLEAKFTALSQEEQAEVLSFDNSWYKRFANRPPPEAKKVKAHEQHLQAARDRAARSSNKKRQFSGITAAQESASATQVAMAATAMEKKHKANPEA